MATDDDSKRTARAILTIGASTLAGGALAGLASWALRGIPGASVATLPAVAVGGAIGANFGYEVERQRRVREVIVTWIPKLRGDSPKLFVSDATRPTAIDNQALGAFVAAILTNGPDQSRRKVGQVAGYVADYLAGPTAGGPSNRSAWQKQIHYQRYLMSLAAWDCFGYGLEAGGRFYLADASGEVTHMWSYTDGIPAFVRWQLAEFPGDLRRNALTLAAAPSADLFSAEQYGQESIADAWRKGGRNWIDQMLRSASDVERVNAASDAELPALVEDLLWARTVPKFLQGPIPSPKVDWGAAFSMLAAWAGAAAAVASGGAAGGLLGAGLAAYDALNR